MNKSIFVVMILIIVGSGSHFITYDEKVIAMEVAFNSMCYKETIGVIPTSGYCVSIA